MPDSVTSIGYCAFTDSTKLSSVTIPSSVTSIAYAAFFRCTSLTSFTMNTKEGYVWKKDNGSTWEIVDVSDPIQNATWFRSDPYYYNYAWSQGPSN